jgi:uncharacterized protein YrrD
MTHDQFIYISDLINNKILTTDSAKEIGKVHDILYNIADKKIIALVLDKGGWFSDAKIIMAANIDSLGKDRAMVKSENCIVTLESDFLKQKPSSLMIDSDQIKKRNIVSQSGTRHGKIDDLSVHPTELKIIAAKASDGFFDNIISKEKWFPIEAIQSIGDDAIIISDDIVPIIEARDNEKLENWKKEMQSKTDEIAKKINS